MRMGVVGCGYVGLVSAACLADMGHNVTCHDIDEDKLKRLRVGELPLYEPGLAEIVVHNNAVGRLRFVTDLRVCLRDVNLVLVAVGTPARAGGGADLGAVQQVCDAVAEGAAADMWVVLKSTVPPGSADALQARLDARLAGRHRVEIISNPEFLKEGMAVEDFRRPDRIVVGVRSPEAAQVMRRLYEPFLRNGHPLLVMDPRSAEVSKYASNVMLAARISMMNELACVCEAVGADITEVRKVVGSDRRVGSAYLYAGLGYGGSCFPKDVQALHHLMLTQQVPTDMLQAVHAVNQRQKLSPVHRLRELCGGSLAGLRVTLWGLAFKPRTDDVREAPALSIANCLLEEGVSVVAHDPIANARAAQALGSRPRLQFCDDMYTAVAGADALVVCTEWDVFRTPDFGRMRASMRHPRLVDGRNLYDPQEVRQHGFVYAGIGRAGV